MAEPVLLVERTQSVATVTLNRPEARNALSRELIDAFRSTMLALDADSEVDVVVITGSDPAFCAGLDLKQLGSSAENIGSTTRSGTVSVQFPWPEIDKPVVGAVNGVAVTGGLEIALNCDILIASDRARFADTHARVGMMPGWGLSVLLPQAVGRGWARRMSFTGDFLSAHDAERVGLVTQVVAHEDLMPTAREVALAIAGNDRRAVRRLLKSYRANEREALGLGRDLEAATLTEWMSGFEPAEIESRRQRVLARGRTQIS